MKRFKPDLMVGGSDTFYIILAASLGRKFGVRFAADLSDNYHSFRSAQIPGVRGQFRKALAEASFITCVSQDLANEVASLSRPTTVVENGVDPERFVFAPKVSCANSPVFGYAGALSPNRGIDLLCGAWPEVRREIPGARLRFVGARHRGVSLPRGAEVTYEGNFAPREIPAFLRSLDVALVLTQPGAFGSFAFPLKFYEALACGTPVLAADQGPLAPLLRAFPANKFAARSSGDLARQMVALARAPQRPELPIPSWHTLAGRWEEALRNLGGPTPP
jgi:glycosyltransferase involved in cell wall biosynthesis